MMLNNILVLTNKMSILIYGCISGFPKLYFQIAPLKEIKKAISPSNKTAQKTTF